MQSLARRARSDCFFSLAGVPGLNLGASFGKATHIADTIVGSDWITAGYGVAGYMLPNATSGAINLTTLQSLPTWLPSDLIAVTGTMAQATDTTSSDMPIRPDTLVANNRRINVVSSTLGAIFRVNISPTFGPKKISFYITSDPLLTPDSRAVGIQARQGTNASNIFVEERVYDNTTTGVVGISTDGGLISQYEVSGDVSFVFRTRGTTLTAGSFHAIFFDD
jgi:hypothetical protein